MVRAAGSDLSFETARSRVEVQGGPGIRRSAVGGQDVVVVDLRLHSGQVACPRGIVVGSTLFQLQRLQHHAISPPCPRVERPAVSLRQRLVGKLEVLVGQGADNRGQGLVPTALPGAGDELLAKDCPGGGRRAEDKQLVVGWCGGGYGRRGRGRRPRRLA